MGQPMSGQNKKCEASKDQARPEMVKSEKSGQKGPNRGPVVGPAQPSNGQARPGYTRSEKARLGQMRSEKAKPGKARSQTENSTPEMVKVRKGQTRKGQAREQQGQARPHLV